MHRSAVKINFQDYMCDESLFRKLFLVTLSFEMLAFLDIAALAFKCILLCLGFFILIHNFFIQGRAFKVKYKCLLWAFIISMVVTSVVHMSIWFVPNLVLALFTAMCFFMFYGMYTSGKRDEIEKEMIFVLKFFVFFATVSSVHSLFTLFLKPEFAIGSYHLGIYQNRFIGIFTNSNILAFSMIECIIACDILSDSYIRNKFKDTKVDNRLLVIAVVLSCVCLFLSDSNASFLFLIIYVTIRVFCNMFFKNKLLTGIKFFRSVVIILGFCIVVMSTSFALRDFCQNCISKLMTETSTSVQMPVEDEQGDSQPSEGLTLVVPPDAENEDEPPTEIHIGREHYEVSSGRITLFKQGLEMFKHNPILGIGRANLGFYSKKYLENGLIHPDLHNGYLTILVCYGILGFCIFAVFSCVVAFDICKHLFLCSDKGHAGIFAKLFSALVAYCGYCLFEKAILFDMTFMVGFFWVMLGYTFSYVENK